MTDKHHLAVILMLVGLGTEALANAAYLHYLSGWVAGAGAMLWFVTPWRNDRGPAETGPLPARRKGEA